MTILSQVKTGRALGQPRVVLYSEPKAGKTTLMASIPNVIFIPLEEGQGTLDYARTPEPTDYETLVETLRELAAGGHEYKAVAIDTLTGVEQLIRDKVINDDFGGSMDKFMAYHKGFAYCASVWVDFCRELDAVRRSGMAVWCSAHSKTEAIDDVSIGSYSRITPQLHKDALAVIAKWSDIIGHIEIERFAQDKGAKDSQRKTRTSSTTGVRQLIVQDTGSHMAGNRYGLASPIELPEENPYGALRDALRAAVAPKAVNQSESNEEAA